MELEKVQHSSNEDGGDGNNNNNNNNNKKLKIRIKKQKTKAMPAVVASPPPKQVVNLKIEPNFAIFDLSNADIKNGSFSSHFEANKLYIPLDPTFPLVDGFYVRTNSIYLL